MNRTRVSDLSYGSIGLCLALVSACSHQATSFPSEGDDGGGAGALSGSSSGGASSSGSQPDNGGDAATGTAPPPTGTSSSSSGGGGPNRTDSGTVATTGPSNDSGTAASCAATMAAGAIPLSANFLEPKVIGNGGYAYPYSDATKGGTSSACLDTLALCGAGMTGAMSAVTYGAGIGFNLNQVMGVSPPMGTFAVTGSGIQYTLSNLPAQGASLIIDNGGMGYCAKLSAASGTAKWADFNLTCWAPTPAGALSGAPATATYVNFQVNAAAAAAPFDFCVTAASFAP